ncbi:MAG: T9SS type A sorting domain-containing protein [Ignavibacteria bacterium]|nr:T9SS type A sorting domain-containing protein [Ignavibacteria bacterium]
MMYVIMAMLMASVCMGQTVVDLPSSFQVFRSNEKLACVATPTTICYGPTAETIRECSTIPVEIDFIASVWSILNMELDPHGRFVYVAVSNANGLYRFDVEKSEWKTIRPSTAGTDVSALYVEQDGSLVIGTGGRISSMLSWNGMFRSTDQGDSWVEVNVRDAGETLHPRIGAIQSTSDGRLIASFVRYSNDKPSGIFIEQSDGKWINVTDDGAPPSLMVVSGEWIYYVKNYTGTVTYVDLRQEPWKQKGLFSSPKRKTIQQWNGDTVAVFLDAETDGVPPEVRLAVGGVVVDTITLEHRPKSSSRMSFGTDVHSSTPSRFIALGCGRNSIVSAQGADVGDVAPGKRLAYVTAIQQTPKWTAAEVSGHGWCTIDINGTAALDTVVGLYLAWGLALNAYSEGWLKSTQFRLIDIRRTTVDTIVDVYVEGDYDTSFSCAVRREDGSLIAATQESGLIEYVPNTWSVRPFSIDGLPDGVAGDSKQKSRINYMFEVDGVLYVWVEALQYPSDTPEGLYVFSSTWSKVDIPLLPEDAYLYSAASDEEGVVLTIRGSQPGEYDGSVALHVRAMNAQPMVYGAQALNDPLLTHAVCAGPTVTWITRSGDVFTSSDPNTVPILVRSGLNSTVGHVGNRLLVATRDSGLFIYDATSSVDESDNNARVRVQAYPQPASSHITFSTRNNEQILRTDIYNVAGELVLSLPHAPSNTITIATDALSSGIYLARIIATSASITLPISILAH